MAKVLSILKTSAIGAVVGGVFGVSKMCFGKFLNGNNTVSSSLFYKYSCLAQSKEYSDIMTKLNKFNMYSQRDFETIVKYVDRFLSIPELIVKKKQFSLIHTAHRYINTVESCLRGMRGQMNNVEIRNDFNEVSKELVDTLNGEVVNMNRDLKSAM